MIHEEKVYTNRQDIMIDYQELVKNERIFFTTFHPSLDYEDFVEGYKPVTIGDDSTNQKSLSYELAKGIFMKAAERARDMFDEEAAKNLRKML